VWGVCKHWTGLLDYWTDNNYKYKWGGTTLVTRDLCTLRNQGSVAEVDADEEQQLKRTQSGTS